MNYDDTSVSLVIGFPADRGTGTPYLQDHFINSTSEVTSRIIDLYFPTLHSTTLKILYSHYSSKTSQIGYSTSQATGHAAVLPRPVLSAKFPW